RGGVGAIGGHVPVPVEQVLPRDAHVVEGQLAVVHTVQTALEAVVGAAHAGQQVARDAVVVLPDRHVEGVHAVVHSARDQLGEDDGGHPVLSGVADVFLPRSGERGVDLEFLGLGVVGGGGGQGGHVTAVPDLGHREATGHAQIHRTGQEPVVVLRGAQVQDGGAEQPPLHAALDLQGGIGHGQFLEPGEVAARIVVAAQTLRKGAVDDVQFDELLRLAQHAFAVFAAGEALLLAQFGVQEQVPHAAAVGSPASVHQISDGGGVDT